MSIFNQKFNALERVTEVMGKLEREESFKYLPSFQCCGSCAWAEIRGFAGSKPSSEFDGFKLFAFFNEQTAESAADSFILYLSIGEFGKNNDDQAAIELVKNALMTGGFKEVFENVNSQHEITYELWNSFFIDTYGVIKIYGDFMGLEQEYDDTDEDLELLEILKNNYEL